MTHTVPPATDTAPPLWVVDLDRVVADINNEGLDPQDFDTIGIAVDMRKLAGERQLDTVSDEHWSEMLDWHRRAPFPVEVA
jgi:hypothetical protein